jgi:hypothetical protein
MTLSFNPFQSARKVNNINSFTQIAFLIGHAIMVPPLTNFFQKHNSSPVFGYLTGNCCSAQITILHFLQSLHLPSPFGSQIGLVCLALRID